MNLVFTFGTPKSGTTFLQMILNHHLEISCPSEHQMGFIKDELTQLIAKYNYILKVVDRRTANQGIAEFKAKDFLKIFKFVVETAAKRGAQGKPVKWFGINDNGIINDLETYLGLFPDAKFICIVRDPRAVALSSWHHNLRVEANFLKRTKNMENWAEATGECWNRDTLAVLNIVDQIQRPGKLLICNYEKLIGDGLSPYHQIFNFLDVNCRDKTITLIRNATRFDKFKDGKFFRSGMSDGWKGELSKTSITLIEQVAGNTMQRMGYETVS